MSAKNNQLTTEERIWVAAVIDCEGMITIHTPWNKQRHNRNLQHYCRVQMTELEMIKRLHAICGGSMKKSTLCASMRTEAWYWNLTAGGLRWLLPQILPFLMAKKRHAEIALKVLAGNQRGRGRQMPFETLRPLLVEMRSLQKSGYNGDIDKIRASLRT